MTAEPDGRSEAGPAPRVVLASASVVRQRLLQDAGVPFVVQVRPVDEAAVREAMQAERAGAGDAAVHLAELKAQRVSAGDPEALVIGADQILVCDGRWFEKPADRAAARSHLQALSGRRHELATAVCVVRGGRRIWHHLDTVALHMRPLGDAFLDGYLESAAEAVTASVGAYQLERLGAQLFHRVEGDFFSVLGLPLLPLLEFLRVQGVLRR